MWPLVGLLLPVSAVCSDSHSLRYYYTGVSAPGSGLPEYSSVGYVDDREIVNYNSESGRTRPKVQWMEKMEEGYWERNTQITKGTEASFRHNVRTAMERFNQSGVRPQVKVSGQEKGDTVKLHCQVYGFHPRAVDVKWKNKEDEVHSYETTHVLPNPDGTYQIRVSAEVTPKDGDRYSCYVDHSSLEKPQYIVWEPEKSSVWVIAVVVAVVVVALLGIGGFIFYRRRKAGYKTTSTSDTSSDSNNPANA
ncbi:class I histocompatibility antigen, F10 alpha chain-like isoform X3 [Dendrobates tinctorius]|uniref:class I histocompatibility antigen, F10 alpha chain-like isoform X3 n=1 Tax=Dendrobates tinctorius TaxID=92724 RepID=UPI003CC932CB